MLSTLPPITLTEENHRMLSDMVDKLKVTMPVAEFLGRELDRARIVSSADIPADVVTLGSEVRFKDPRSAAIRSVRLVNPADENVSGGLLSILTPVGVALLGLSAGQHMEWETRDGRTLGLRLLEVTYQPEAAGRAQTREAVGSAR
ncbi:MAG TPA: nucleoside diphosphate kinase regulator [Alphaproteobacteria bacterium]|nr:nucleoside diphosphate kinase regulator [Alphaproteobacteria bacterium]